MFKHQIECHFKPLPKLRYVPAAKSYFHTNTELLSGTISAIFSFIFSVLQRFGGKPPPAKQVYNSKNPLQRGFK
jgi:hypothetical protein